VNVVGDEWKVESKCPPLSREEEKNVEEYVNNILWNYQL